VLKHAWLPKMLLKPKPRHCCCRSVLSLLLHVVTLQEAGIRAYQAQLLSAWDEHRPAIEAVDSSLTLQELRHAAGLVRKQQQPHINKCYADFQSVISHCRVHHFLHDMVRSCLASSLLTITCFPKGLQLACHLVCFVDYSFKVPYMCEASCRNEVSNPSCIRRTR
jgi:hypothetical protein